MNTKFSKLSFTINKYETDPYAYAEIEVRKITLR